MQCRVDVFREVEDTEEIVTQAAEDSEQNSDSTGLDIQIQAAHDHGDGQTTSQVNQHEATVVNMMQLLNCTADTNSGPMVKQSLFAETEQLGYWLILG